ncbi:MAG: VOC family protein, partial [Candidatus Eremiobacteraeota bacterium]|nr:VOC family protein [Candidatus Eremiobacteraeota bacterium]
MLVCSDLERSRNFYAEVLKLPIKTRTELSIDFELGNGATLGIHKRTRLLAVRPGS